MLAVQWNVMCTCVHVASVVILWYHGMWYDTTGGRLSVGSTPVRIVISSYNYKYHR